MRDRIQSVKHEKTHGLFVPKFIPPSTHPFPPQVEVSSLQQLVLTKNAEIEDLHAQLLSRPPSSAENSEKGKPPSAQSLRCNSCSLVCLRETDRKRGNAKQP